MTKKQNGGNKNKKRTEKTLRQLTAKKNISNASKARNVIKIEGQKPATQLQLFEMQKTLSTRIDTALMSAAALAKIMVDKGLCTWDEFKEGEKKMLEDLKFIRETMAEAVKFFGPDNSKKEDIGEFIYEKGIAFGMDVGVLDGIFGVKKSKSRIIKPSQVKIIQPNK